MSRRRVRDSKEDDSSDNENDDWNHQDGRDDWPLQATDPLNTNDATTTQALPVGAAAQACNGRDVYMKKSATVLGDKVLAIFPGLLNVHPPKAAATSVNATMPNGGGQDETSPLEAAASTPVAKTPTTTTSSSGPTLTATTTTTAAAAASSSQTTTILGHWKGSWKSQTPVLEMNMSSLSADKQNEQNADASAATALVFEGQAVPATTKFVVLTLHPNRQGSVTCRAVLDAVLVLKGKQVQQQGVAGLSSSSHGVDKDDASSLEAEQEDSKPAAVATKDDDDETKHPKVLRHYGASARAWDGALGKPNLHLPVTVASTGQASTAKTPRRRRLVLSLDDPMDDDDDDNDDEIPETQQKEAPVKTAQWHSSDSDQDSDVVIPVAPVPSRAKSARRSTLSKKPSYKDFDKEASSSDDDNDDDDDEESPQKQRPARNARGRRAATKVTQQSDEDASDDNNDEEEEREPPVVARASRGAKKKAVARKPLTADSSDESEEPTKRLSAASKRTSARKAPPSADNDDDESSFGDDSDAPVASSKKGTAAKNTKKRSIAELVEIRTDDDESSQEEAKPVQRSTRRPRAASAKESAGKSAAELVEIDSDQDSEEVAKPLAPAKKARKTNVKKKTTAEVVVVASEADDSEVEVPPKRKTRAPPTKKPRIAENENTAKKPPKRGRTKTATNDYENVDESIVDENLVDNRKPPPRSSSTPIGKEATVPVLTSPKPTPKSPDSTLRRRRRTTLKKSPKVVDMTDEDFTFLGN